MRRRPGGGWFARARRIVGDALVCKQCGKSRDIGVLDERGSCVMGPVDPSRHCTCAIEEDDGRWQRADEAWCHKCDDPGCPMNGPNAEPPY